MQGRNKTNQPRHEYEDLDEGIAESAEILESTSIRSGEARGDDRSSRAGARNTDRAGEPIIGVLQSEGATISIRDGYGRTRSIAGGDLDGRIPLKPSLMPDPLSLALTEQDVADIVAFLERR